MSIGQQSPFDSRCYRDFSRDDVERYLEPGDIILKYHPEGDGQAAFIRLGQYIIHGKASEASDHSYKMIHAAIYIGKGQIAEAVGSGVRVVSMSDKAFMEKGGKSLRYLVFRPENESIARKAAKLARQSLFRTEGVRDYAPYHYSVQKAIASALISANINKEAVRRYLKAYLSSSTGSGGLEAHGKDGELRKFHCSYLVGWIYHAAESQELIDDINRELPESEKIALPDLSTVYQTAKKGKLIHQWAKEITEKHFNALRSRIQLKLDPKYTTPQKLYEYFLRHTEQFKHVLTWGPPSSSPENPEFYYKNGPELLVVSELMGPSYKGPVDEPFVAIPRSLTRQERARFILDTIHRLKSSEDPEARRT